MKTTDVLTRNGETAVLIDGLVLRLSVLSTVIWELTHEPTGVDELAHALEAQFGAPSDRSLMEATQDAVTSLLQHGVLRQSD